MFVIYHQPISLFVQNARLHNISWAVRSNRVLYFDLKLPSCQSPFHRASNMSRHPPSSLYNLILLPEKESTIGVRPAKET